MKIEKTKESEIGKLEDMLYEAIYQPDEDNLIPRTVLKIPEVYAYIKDFGKSKDDYCLVADSHGEIVGAVWVRIISDDIKGYGYIDDNTPEFAISLYKDYRNRGIGAKLMTAMLKACCWIYFTILNRNICKIISMSFLINSSVDASAKTYSIGL
jgi:ribosomal protein S18 acetylase RimI-like enzyme